jgi:ubiquinone/menaquinone biosynthesis C-methylase UbiE
MAERKHQDVMAELVPLNGAHVLDIGCGDGRITRMIAAAGGHVVGVDPGEKQIERAEAAARVADERYILGSAENLPAADASADIVFFFNSLHHVPEAAMDRALDEARRALKPEGWLFIAEPLAEGPQFELQKPYNDETEVRARAYEAIGRAKTRGFDDVGESRYAADGKHASFEAYRENSIAINPKRAQVFADREAEIRARFERYGEKRPDGWHFPNFIRVNVLRKRG